MFHQKKIIIIIFTSQCQNVVILLLSSSKKTEMQRFSLTNKTFTIGINQVLCFFFVLKFLILKFFFQISNFLHLKKKYPPFIRIDVDGSTILGGFEIKILYLLRDYFNFSTKFINTHDNYGKLLTNGTWTGMFGNLTTNVG